MSWINMLGPWQWLVMAAVPPLIVMLYFLKLRRAPVEVPSTYLWRRTLEDLHVNSIWQRLRKNLLLLLQLLALLALILACLRPGMRGEQTLGNRSIFMIDNSCSMQATDVETSRLEEAKRQTRAMLDGLAPGDVAMVVAFSDRADVRQGFTGDKRKLKAAVEAIQPTNRTTDLNEALRAAAGLANPGRTSQIEDMVDIQVAEALPASLYILSDGGFGTPQMDLGNLTAEYIPIGNSAVRNVGILAFTVERNTENNGQVAAFSRVYNFGSEPVEFRVSLMLNGELVDASDVAIEAQSATGVAFELAAIDEGQLRLELEVEDDFAFDNVAFAGLDPPRQLEVVLVSSGNTALEAALATPQAQSLASLRTVGPGDVESAEFQQLAESGTVDLFIFDQCAPQTLPASNTLFIGMLPPGDAWRADEPSGPLFVIDTNRAHPMLQYVDLGTVKIVEGRALQMPAGGTELARSNAGILMAVAPRDAYQDAVIAMPFLKRTEGGDVANTDWPIKRSFPVFVFNALEYLGGAVSTAGARSVQPGQPVALNLASRFSQVEILNPQGGQTSVDRTGQAQLIFTQTEEPGFYEARGAGSDRMLQMFTVNLFSEQESNLAPRADVMIGAQNVIASDAVREVVRIEYWRWLLAAALVVLSVEWVVYTRRVAI